MTRVKVLVLPVYRRHWLYHTWVEGGGVDPRLLDMPWWQAGPQLQDKWTALTAQLSHKMNGFVAEQWALNEAAKEGTFRHWLHRLALNVKSREDPVESFLKKLPRSSSVPEGQVMVLEVLYPTSLHPTLVRRRLRHIATRMSNTHRRALMGWTLACLPQMPLMLTPLPNVTLYYTLYKLFNSYGALGGSSTLLAATANPASYALQRAVEEAEGSNQQQAAHLLQQQPGGAGWGRRRGDKAGGRLGPLSPEQRLEALLQKLGIPAGHGQHTQHAPPHHSHKEASTHSSHHHPHADPWASATGFAGSGQTGADPQLSRLEGELQRQLAKQGGGAAGQGKGGLQPLIVYLPSAQLEEAVQPLERWRTPLEDTVVGRLALLAPHWASATAGLAEPLARLRKRAVAAEEARDKQRGRTSPTPPSQPAQQQQQSAGACSRGAAGGPPGNNWLQNLLPWSRGGARPHKQASADGGMGWQQQRGMAGGPADRAIGQGRAGKAMEQHQPVLASILPSIRWPAGGLWGHRHFHSSSASSSSSSSGQAGRVPAWMSGCSQGLMMPAGSLSWGLGGGRQAACLVHRAR